MYLLPLGSKVMHVMADRSCVPPNSKTWCPVSKSQTFTTWNQQHIELNSTMLCMSNNCGGHVAVLTQTGFIFQVKLVICVCDVIYSQIPQCSWQLDETPHCSRSTLQAHYVTQSDDCEDAALQRKKDNKTNKRKMNIKELQSSLKEKKNLKFCIYWVKVGCLIP